MLRMDVMEGRCALLDKRCLTCKGLIAKQVRWIWKQSRWYSSWRWRLSGTVYQFFGSTVWLHRAPGEPLRTITVSIRRSKWNSFLFLRVALQDALSEVMEVHPSMKLKVFVTDVTAWQTVQKRFWRRWEWKWRRRVWICWSRKEGRKGRTRSLRHVVFWKRCFINASRE